MLLAAKRRLAAFPDPHYHRRARVMQDIPSVTGCRWNPHPRGPWLHAQSRSRDFPPRRQFVKIKSQKDFFAGLMFMGVGVAFAWGATTYNVGNGARMGPGYFPLLLGILLAIIGGAITFKATTVETQDGDKIGKWAWKPLFFILAANFAFGILLGSIGGAITFKATTVETQDGDKIGKWAWKPLFFILAANFAFGILLGGLP